MQSFDIPLHDIKPIVEVDEYSLYYLISLIGASLLVLALVFYAIYFIYKKMKEVSLKKESKIVLESLDFSDTKKTAYAMSRYGDLFKDDSPEHKEIFEKLTQKLLEYKYKKSVASFDDETLALFETYKGMLRV